MAKDITLNLPASMASDLSKALHRLASIAEGELPGPDWALGPVIDGARKIADELEQAMRAAHVSSHAKDDPTVDQRTRALDEVVGAVHRLELVIGELNDELRLTRLKAKKPFRSVFEQVFGRKG